MTLAGASLLSPAWMLGKLTNLLSIPSAERNPNFVLLVEVRPLPWDILSRPVVREAVRLSVVRFLGQAEVLNLTRKRHEWSTGFSWLGAWEKQL